MRRWIGVSALLALWGAAPVGAQTGPMDEFIGRVQRVAAADQLIVLRDGQPVRVQLHGVSEPPQTCRGSARNYLQRLTESRSVQVKPVRVVNRHALDAHVQFIGGKDLALELVGAGWVRWDPKQKPANRSLGLREAQARQARRGLWAFPPEPPKRGIKRTASRPMPNRRAASPHPQRVAPPSG